MFKFVQQYATQEIIVLMVAVMGWLWKKILAEKKESSVLREGIIALLYDRLYKVCIMLIHQGYASIADKRNLEHLAEPYFSLGGNGTGKELFEECMALPMEEVKE